MTESPGTSIARAGVVLAVTAAASTFGLLRIGLSPLIAATVAAGLVSVFAWAAARSFGANLTARTETLTRALEAGKEQAEGREKLLRTVVEATPLALLFYADAGRIVYANTEARRLFFEGESPEGQNFLRIVSQAPEVLRVALLGDSDELFSVDVGGQPETYHLSRRTFPFDNEMHTLLLVRHLTREVSRREVDVLRKVIRVISHELNNSLAPVASLVHSARLISKTPEHHGKLDRVFDTIEERARHLAAFLSGYADLARIPKARPAAADFGPLLRQLGALFPAAKIGPAPEAPGYFDAAQIEQLFINLLKNATEAGGPAGDVELTVSPEAEGAVKVEISDRGHGLTEEALESAFVPFYSTKTHGSGLGLALCREVVEAHGGRMSIKNRNGGGCTVTCWLPGRAPHGHHAGSERARLTLTRP
jgi:two-component system nitrogen regulation sensor histidine kinase NtrY